MNEREALLKKIKAYGFAAFEWNLYLDTHPYDRDGIAKYHEMAQKANESIREFEMMYGPLTAAASSNTERWDWIDEPWPWDK